MLIPSPHPTASSALAALEAALTQGLNLGYLRRLDVEFARALPQLSPSTPATAVPALILGGALLAHLEGCGHSCLDLALLTAQAHQLLAWPHAEINQLQQLLHTLNLSTPAQWLEALAQSDAVDAGPTGWATPLVLHGQRLYLRRYWQYEQRVAQQIKHRLQHPSQHPVDPATLRAHLDQLFELKPELALDVQKIACALALRGGLNIITGGPGTGKTHTVARLLALRFATHPDAEHLRVALAAPTGKAAARLKQSIEKALDKLPTLSDAQGNAWHGDRLRQHLGPAQTLHALLGARPDTRQLAYHAQHRLELDVLVVDEASMIHLEMMAALLEALPEHAQIILLGDKDQLASVEAGAVLGDLCVGAEHGHYQAETAAYVHACTGQQLPPQWLAPPQQPASSLAQHTVMLRHSWRFQGPIGQLAQAVNQGQVAAALALFPPQPSAELTWLRHAQTADLATLAVEGHHAAPGGYRQYLQALAAYQRDWDGPTFADWARQVLQAFDQFRVLCALREGDWGVAGLNRRIEEACVQAGLLKKRGEWYIGRPVLITRNDTSLGVYNGDIGITLPAPGHSELRRVYFLDGEGLRSVLCSRLADVETAFAMTVHKSQGSEFKHTVLVLPAGISQVLTRELVYTGITRARENFTLVSAQNEVLVYAIGQKTQRTSGLLEAMQPNPTEPCRAQPPASG